MSKRKNQARRHAQSVEEQEDVFVANVLEASRWAETHRQLMILGVDVTSNEAGGKPAWSYS